MQLCMYLPKDWIEDREHENGCCWCECSECGTMFVGHKRRKVCKLCATKETTDGN